MESSKEAPHTRSKQQPSNSVWCKCIEWRKLLTWEAVLTIATIALAGFTYLLWSDTHRLLVDAERTATQQASDTQKSLTQITRAADAATDSATAMKNFVAAAAAQAGAATKSAFISEKSFVASQRAWMTTGSPQSIDNIKVGAPINIEMISENIGRSPAIGVSHHDITTVFDMPEQLEYAPEIWSPDFGKVIRMSCSLAVPGNGRATVFPGMKVTSPIHWNNQRDIEGILNGKKILVTYGCTGYLTMGEQHFTPYCIFLSVDKNTSNLLRFGSCPIGNDAN